MLAKATKPLKALTHLMTSNNQQDIAIAIGQSMIIQHTCPYCSNTLLRHMRWEGLYWQCCSCRQEMPV